uniref:Disintegrin and metalloproteinase domain-containing protein 32-like n=2 Tax=Chinchilla lanigera TaxID=34839 RepID=A0A8C2UL44_CHILA
MLYFYNQSVMNSQSVDTQSECYYQGYIKEYPNSVVTLNACSGLRGILQFQNVSYGIEPVESTSEFQHILYQLGNENNEPGIFTKNSRSMEEYPVDYNIFISEKPQTPPDLSPLYLEMYIVVDKALYDYFGSDSTTVTNNIMEMTNLVNSMFSQFKVVIVLSSLELWSDTNKISTVGKADEVLHRFSEWKQSHLTLRPHDVAYLFIYRDYPDFMGATFPGKMCVTPYSAGIAVYPKDLTLETFAVIVTQMLGLSLGMSYDDPMKCQCSEAICIMNLQAVQSSGMKTFSSCSLKDFQSFASNVGVRCLQNKPQMRSNPICGNGIKEGKEACDCGTLLQCGLKSCCDPEKCTVKPGSECADGPCCKECKFADPNVVCRPKEDPECDIPEYCPGSSAVCPPNVFVKNGHKCRGSFICYNSFCMDLDTRCKKLFGDDSENAPFICYKEIHIHVDRFGHCGLKDNRLLYCGWRNFRCGRLICTYPYRAPFFHPNVSSVLYLRIRNYTCITAVYETVPDPFKIPDGTECDYTRICVTYRCLLKGTLENDSAECTKACNGRGICDNSGACHCEAGTQPPFCSPMKSLKSPWHMRRGLTMRSASEKASNNWLLSFYIGLSILIIATITAVAWNRLKKVFTKEEESLNSESISDDTTQASTSRN